MEYDGLEIGEEFATVSVEGARATFATSDDFSRWLFERQRSRGLYEGLATREFLRLVHADSCVLDVGANIGWYALLAASKCRNGRVYAFELDADNCDRLRANVRLNASPNIDLCHMAVGATGGWRSYDAAVSPSPLEHAVLPNCEGPRLVTQVCLDSWCHESGVNPDIVKIDVEGAELDVLAGMQQVMAAVRPIVFVEFHARPEKTRAERYHQLCHGLSKNAYSLVALSKDVSGRPEAVPSLPGSDDLILLAKPMACL